MPEVREREAFLERFFSGRNRYQWLAITAGEAGRKEIYPWAERLLQDPPLPTVLPYATEGGTVWYAIAPTDFGLRRLSDDLMAFLGPTWSTLRGVPVRLKPHDDIDREVITICGGNAFKFRGVEGPLDQTGLRQAMERMRVVWGREQRSDASMPQSREQLLLQFNMALAASNRTEAEQALEALRNQQYLTPQNLLFLRVRMLHDLGHVRELLNLGDWDDLLANRRPLAVTEAMAGAVHAVYLATLEAEGDYSGALETYRTTLRSRFGFLAAYHGNSQQADLLKLRMYHALSEAHPDLGLLDALLTIPKDAVTRSVLERLRPLAPVLAPSVAVPVKSVAPAEDSTVVARDALDECDFDRAYALACALPPSDKKVQILAACTEEFGTLESEQTFLQAFDELPAPTQDCLLRSKRYQQLIERLTRTPKVRETRLPVDWLSWVEAVIADPSWKEALDVADRGVREWSFEAIAETPSKLAVLVGLLRKQHAPESQRVLMNGLPYLIQAILDLKQPTETFRELYAVLLDLLIIEGTGKNSEASLFLSLASALLTVGVDRSGYGELVVYAQEIWTHIASPSGIDWLLTFWEYLAVYPCPDLGIRQASFATLCPGLRQYVGRMNAFQYQSLDGLSEEFGMRALLAEWPQSDVGTDEQNANDLTVLAGKKMLMYSLQGPMMLRVGRMIEKRCHGVRITYAMDHGGNATLRSRVQEADIVVMHTWHSKHAATNFIEQHLDASTELIRPEGKGSASIMRALQAYCSRIGS